MGSVGKKDNMEMYDPCFKEYRRLGGIHDEDEFMRYIDILSGIIKVYQEVRHQCNAESIFSELISSSDLFQKWVNYTGSIKEAKIYIKSLWKIFPSG